MSATILRKQPARAPRPPPPSCTLRPSGVVTVMCACFAKDKDASLHPFSF